MEKINTASQPQPQWERYNTFSPVRLDLIKRANISMTLKPQVSFSRSLTTEIIVGNAKSPGLTHGNLRTNITASWPMVSRDAYTMILAQGNQAGDKKVRTHNLDIDRDYLDYCRYVEDQDVQLTNDFSARAPASSMRRVILSPAWQPNINGGSLIFPNFSARKPSFMNFRK